MSTHKPKRIKLEGIFSERDFAKYAIGYNNRRVLIHEDRKFLTMAIIPANLEISIFIFDKVNKTKTMTTEFEIGMKHNTLNLKILVTSCAEDLFELINDTLANCYGKGAEILDKDGFMQLLPGRYNHGRNALKRLTKNNRYNVITGRREALNIPEWEILAYTEDPDSDMAQAIIAHFTLEDAKVQVGWTSHPSNIVGNCNGGSRFYATRDEFKLFDILEDSIKSDIPTYPQYLITWVGRLIMTITDTTKDNSHQSYDFYDYDG